MTADHCFGDAGEVDEDVTVQLGATQEISVLHTKITSGRVRVWDVDGSRETDMALVRLDEAAPPPYALPAPPSLTPNACGNQFDGRLVGYGPTGYNENGFSCSGEPTGTRRYGRMVDWTRDHQPPGSLYLHEFSSPEQYVCEGFSGMGIGKDSGGSLYRDSDGQFCGIISGDGFFNCDSNEYGGLACNYHTAAVDDADAIAWWSQYLLDVDGHFEGTVPAAPQNDPDADGIPSAYDNCPHVYNPEQLTTIDDPDGNGLGAACDACPGVPGVYHGTNRNREVELAVAYPTLLDYPVLKRSDYPNDAAFSAARAAYLAAFKPDACDPHPAPVTQLQTGGDLPAGFTAPTTSSQNWPCLAWTQGCTAVTQNKIKVSPLSTPQSAGANERIGLRWCDCKAVPGFGDTVNGRAKCRTDPFAGCLFDEGRYDQTTSGWKKLTTKAGSNWNTPALGAEWLVASGGAPFYVTWDFSALTAALETETNYAGVRGILWTHVVEVIGGQPSLTPENVKRYANALSDGSAHRSYGPSGHLWVAFDPWVECPMCLLGLEQILFERGNPWLRRVTPQGLDVLELEDAATLGHFDAVGAGTRLHVAASEPPALLAKLIAPGQSLVRGVGLSLSGAPVSKLTSTDLRALPLATALSGSGGPTFVRGEGLAFSATEQRLYVLGGLTASNQPKNAGWFFDLSSSTWRQFPMPPGESVGEVLAMAYRQADRAIYFLDKSGSTLRLRRWHAQRKLGSGALVTLATFPTSWNAFGKYAVTMGPAGDLAVVAYRGTGSTKTRIGRFTLSRAHRLSKAGLSSLTTQALGPPALTADGFAFTADQTTPTAQTLLFAAMASDWRSDSPTIGAH